MQKFYTKGKTKVSNEGVRGPKQETIEYLMQFARICVSQNTKAIQTNSFMIN